jgi:hypothetical protein
MEPAEGERLMAKPPIPDARLRTVFIIRHGEKPHEGPHLSETGRARARALADLFGGCFRKPDLLIAAANKPKSCRPVETLEPLAAALGLAIDDRFETEDVDRVAAHLRQGQVPVEGAALIAWRHDAIPQLARALGARNAPSKWPEHVFDRVWRLLYSADGAVRFADLAQSLLPGDASS